MQAVLKFLKQPLNSGHFVTDRGQGTLGLSQAMGSDWFWFQSYFCHKLTVSSWTYHLTDLRVTLVS